VFLTASPLTFLVARLSFLRHHCSVVDANVVDQTRPEAARLKQRDYSGLGQLPESSAAVFFQLVIRIFKSLMYTRCPATVSAL
jgi:hypothetical protein